MWRHLLSSFFSLTRALGFVSCLQSNRGQRESRLTFAGFRKCSSNGFVSTSLSSHFHFQANSFSCHLKAHFIQFIQHFYFSLWWKSSLEYLVSHTTRNESFFIILSLCSSKSLGLSYVGYVEMFLHSCTCKTAFQYFESKCQNSYSNPSHLAFFVSAIVLSH